MAKPWTVTQIAAFENCPWQYEGRYESYRLPFVETEETRNGNRVHQQLYLRLAGGHELPSELAFVEPVCRSIQTSGEVKAELALGIDRELKPVDYNSKSAWHRIKIDVAVLNGSSAALFDWKTGNDKYENYFQLDMAAMDIMLAYPTIQKVSVANYYLKTRKLGTPRTYERDKDLQKLTVDAFQRSSAIERVRAAGTWPKMQGPLCKYCSDKACEFNRSEQ